MKMGCCVDSVKMLKTSFFGRSSRAGKAENPDKADCTSEFDLLRDFCSMESLKSGVAI